MNKRMKTQKGAAMVEFAIVLPLLLVLIFGIIEFGNLLMKFNTLNKITMDAARYMSIWQPGNSAIIPSVVTSAQNVMNCGITAGCSSTGYFTLDSAQTLNASIDNATGLITVTVTYSYQPIFSQIFNLNISLKNRPLVSTVVVQAIS